MLNMESPMKDKRLQSLTTDWNNGSRSSLHTNSDAATFHSAADVHKLGHPQQMELHPINNSTATRQQQTLPSPILQATKMSRKDSGFSEIPTSRSSSRRASTSTSTSRRTSPSKAKRRSHQSTSSYSSRPGTRRASKSAIQTPQLQSSRPILNSRHTTPFPSTPPNNTAPQFFHFPSFPTPESSPNSHLQAPQPPPPPPTVQYWTSDDTRRLEYAAIDAASRGIRGFVTKLVPDCMLPKEFRRTKFCQGDEGSEAGSVRRYRLDLPDEIEAEKKSTRPAQRGGFFRRLSGGFKTSTS